MNKHLLSGSGTAVNFEKLTTLSNVLTAIVTWWHVMAFSRNWMWIRGRSQ